MFLAGAAVACGGGAAQRVEVRIGRLAVSAELARTPEERARGLGGRASLMQDAGMLFVFPGEGQPDFWMKDMRFPLDFIWISADRHVVDLTENVPPPAPGTPDSDLPRYRPRAAVLYTLEVNAGAIAVAGLRLGDAVTFDPVPSREGVR